MIGKLRGQVDEQGDDFALIDVGGVGYVVFASARTLSALPPAGQSITLWIETHVREDHIHLYGFAEEGERTWFKLLSTVQGVGAKMALSILASLPPEELVRTIAAQDKASLTRANGVGPKLAQRILGELKDKVGNMSLGAGLAASGGASAPALSNDQQDAVEALVNLGFKRNEAFGAVAKIAGELGESADLNALVKGGLQELAR